MSSLAFGEAKSLPVFQQLTRVHPLLLIKPRCFFNEVCHRLPGDCQPRRREVVAREVDAAFDPADECPFRVQPVSKRRLTVWVA